MIDIIQPPAPGRAEIHRDRAEPPSRPRSLSGKSRDKFDALEHARYVAPILRTAEFQAEFDDRLDIWIADLDARNDVERVMVRRAVEISFELDHLTRVVQARRAALGHALAQGRAAQAEEVVALGRRLYFDPVGPLWLYPHPAPAPAASEPKSPIDRLAQLEGRLPRPAPAAAEPRRISDSGDPDDPDDPARLVVRLEALTLGCAWLLDRWGELKDLLEDGLSWQPHDRLKAVRMLGRQPLEAVDDKRVMSIYTCCWYMDPTEGHEFVDLMSELGAGERGMYMDRLNAREPMVPEGPEAARLALLALIAEEEERLEAILVGHLEREEAEATAALAFDATPEGERLRKYKQALDRELLRIIETLRKRHKEADAKEAPGGRASRRAGSAAVRERASLVVQASGLLSAAGTAASQDPACERASVPAELDPSGRAEPDPTGAVGGGSVTPSARSDPTGCVVAAPDPAGRGGPDRSPAGAGSYSGPTRVALGGCSLPRPDSVPRPSR